MKTREKYLNKSLKFLQKNNPSLAHQLMLVDPSGLDFCLTEKNEWNLQRIYQGQIYYYHSQNNALLEAEEWFKSLNIKYLNVIFIYGIGLGYYYQACQDWLKKNVQNRLIFLEEDLSVIHRLCETDLGVQLIKDSQVRIFHFEDISQDVELLNELSWTYFKTSFLVSCLKLYQQVNQQGFLELQHQIVHSFQRKKLFVSEYLNYGSNYYRNFYNNLIKLPQSFLGNGLFGKFNGVPAIICGAGPSLSKNKHYLLELKNRALIFAGGSTLSALIPNGIFPHFGVAIDPNDAQYGRIAAIQPVQIPFFYRSRLYSKALEAICGPRLYLTGGGGYETAKWFETHLGIDGIDLSHGHNVINLSVMIAQALGCNPIILIGVDLSFSEEQFYAEGIANHLNLKNKTLIDDEEWIEKKDIMGRDILTNWKWMIEGQWMSEFAEKHSEIIFINATEGGLGFKNIPNERFESVIQRFLKEERMEIRHIDEYIQKNKLSYIHLNQIKEACKEMGDSLERCRGLYANLIEETGRLIKLGEKESTAVILLNNEIEEEIAYRYVVEIFDKVYRHLYLREVNELKLKRESKKKRVGIHKLNRERFCFLCEVIECNLMLLREVLK